MTDIFTGSNHSFCKVESKNKPLRYFAWGQNNYGQLGLGAQGVINYGDEITWLKGKQVIDM